MNESAVQKERREQRQSLFVNETEEPFKLPLQFDALLTELKREIAAYDNVLDAIRLERDVLAKPSLKAIMESNSRKEEALLQAKDVERKRDNLLRKIAALLHLPSEQIRLTAVVDAAD
ncbi:MAG: hypothetical protein JW950_04270, partial [Deltaproteobacteria bacterium]|nr:hypothetical protein [Deltaproteobacteria bacterium]